MKARDLGNIHIHLERVKSVIQKQETRLSKIYTNCLIFCINLSSIWILILLIAMQSGISFFTKMQCTLINIHLPNFHLYSYLL